MMKTCVGSCHCGAVRFECELDLTQETSRCNCSICTKSRFWKSMVRPSAFRLLQGDADLTEYVFGSHNIHHLFCGHCGVKPFAKVDDAGGMGELYAINVACLDNVTDAELASTPVVFQNGREGHWEASPAEARYL